MPRSERSDPRTHAVGTKRTAFERRQFRHALAPPRRACAPETPVLGRLRGHQPRLIAHALVASWLGADGAHIQHDMQQNHLRRVNGAAKPAPTSAPKRLPDRASLARWLTMALGLWLLLSPWFWSHSAQSSLNTRINGAIIVAASAWALRALSGRYLLATAACWLYVSTVSMRHLHGGTVLNNALVAVAVLVLSLVPKRDERWRTGGL